jgi:phage shock protein E
MSIMAVSCSGQTSKPKANNADTSKKETSKTENKMKTIIVDVRTTGEWDYDGHADCSVNIPLDKLQGRIDELKAYDKVVLVCRSGARAGSAKQMLEGAGIANVENLGPWQNITCQ